MSIGTSAREAARPIRALTLAAASIISVVACQDDAPVAQPVAQPPVSENVMVYANRGTLQCEVNSGTRPEDSALRLIRQGLDVLATHCAVRTNVVFPAVCGGGTGEILLHEIRGVSVDVALREGFTLASTLNGAYVRFDCVTRVPY